MEVSKKRKRDVDCPRITYDATTKVFDRLFKEESLEEMKNVVRKKLGLPSSLPVHLAQLRDGKSVVLEDDDDFDAFYACVHSTAAARIKIFLDDDQPNVTDPDAGFAGEPVQLPGSPTVHNAAADGHSPSKKRKVSFVEPISQSAGDNVEDPNSNALPEVPASIDVISADAEKAHEMADNTKKKETMKRNKKTVDSTSEDQSLGEQLQSDIAVVEASGFNSKISAKMTEDTPYNTAQSKKRRRTSTTNKSVESVGKALDGTAARIGDVEGYSRSTKKSKSKRKSSEDLENGVTDVGTKLPEDMQRRTPFIRQADSLKVDVASDWDSNSPASTSALEANSNGKTKNPGPSQSLETPTKLTLNEDDTQCEQKTKSSASTKGKAIVKKSRKIKEPLELLEGSISQNQALNNDLKTLTEAAVAAILARKSLPGEGNKQTVTRSSPLTDVTALSPSIAPVTLTSAPDNHLVPPDNTSTIAEHAEQPNTTPKCPVCNETPSHIRSRCPIIKAGIRSMGWRIAELQRETPDEEREKVIEELQQRIIDKRAKRTRTPATGNKSTNVRSIADKPVSLPTPAADVSPVLEPKTSQVVEPAKAPSQEVKSMPLSHLTESLSFDVSSYTAQDLEALIRGPNVTPADLLSSDSSEDEEVLEEEPEEVQFEPSQIQGRIRYPSSSEEEEEEEEEASPFVPSIIPLPIRSVSELSNEDESSHSEDLQGDTSFHEVNGLGSSIEVDKTGDAAVDEAYALDFAHLNAPEPSENERKVTGDILIALSGNQVSDESEPKMASDAASPSATIVTPQPTPQSDPIEASEQPESLSQQSPIVSAEEDIHPLQSTPKAEVAGRKSQRISSILARKITDLTPKSRNVASRTGVNGSNSTKKTGGLTRITDLPIPITPAIRVTKPVTRRRARAEEEEEETADEQGPTDAFQTKQKNGELSGSKTSPYTTKTPVKTVKTSSKIPAKVGVSSKRENLEAQSVTVVQGVLETVESSPSNAEQSLASWAILERNSLAESETTGMVDELRYSPNTSDLPTPTASPAVVNGVSKKPDPLFLHSESQQSFPYSQYPEPPGSEDEEDEVQASVVKPQTTTKSPSRFRSLSEIASQPSLFTSTMRLTQTNSTTNFKEEVMNLYGRASKGEEESEESEDSDTESDDAGAKAQSSHIPLSRRAGTLLS